MSRGPDVAALLARALLADAGAMGCAVAVGDSSWTRWASATFAGARHVMELHAMPSPYLDAWLSQLPEAEFALRGNLVADLVVEVVRREAGGVTVSLEVLTIEER